MPINELLPLSLISQAFFSVTSVISPAGEKLEEAEQRG